MSYENSDFHSFVYSEEVLALVRAANDFSAYMEEFSESEGRQFVERMPALLTAIYAAILKVEDNETLLESAMEPSVSEQDWSALFQKIARLLGGHNEVLRPAEEDEFDDSDLVTHRISEDLADVYQELRDFTGVYSRGMEEMMNDATWELKERFAEHWGRKLLRALSALHDLYVSGIDPLEE